MRYDHYTYGMLMDGRKGSTPEYRYGFNGIEKDDEVKGEGNSYDFGARMYDARVGRWLSSDPLENKFPKYSPYIFVANTPIIAIDPDGRDIIFVIKNKEGEDEKVQVESFETLVNKINSVDNQMGLEDKESLNLISQYANSSDEHLYIAVGNEYSKESESSLGGTVLFSGNQTSKLLDEEGKVGQSNVERAKEYDPSLSMLENFIGVSVDSDAKKNAFIVLDQSFFNEEIKLDDNGKQAARTLGHEIGAHVQNSHNSEGKRKSSQAQHRSWGQTKWSGPNDFGMEGTPSYYLNIYINFMEKGLFKENYEVQQSNSEEGTYKVEKKTN